MDSARCNSLNKILIIYSRYQKSLATIFSKLKAIPALAYGMPLVNADANNPPNLESSRKYHKAHCHCKL